MFAQADPTPPAPQVPRSALDAGILDPAVMRAKVSTWIDAAVPAVADYGMKCLFAVIILLAGRVLARVSARVIQRAMLRARIEPALCGFASSMIHAAIMAFAIIAAIDKVGVPTTSFVAVVGAAGLAIGFALQGSLSNFAAGVMILVFRPFRVGDWIEAGGVAGSVKDIDLFTCALTTADNQRIVVPNSTITGGVIVNATANPTRRIQLVVGVAYEADLDHAQRVLREEVASHARVLQDPEPVVHVQKLAESSVDFVIWAWARREEFGLLTFELTKAIKLRLDREGIAIPFPQREVRLIQAAAS